MADPWMCPRCQSPQVVTSAAFAFESRTFEVAPLGWYGIETELICCADATCGGYRFSVRHGPWDGTHTSGVLGLAGDPANTPLVPASCARSYPDYVPASIRNDYEEACAIERGSPKAAATLARRALQGMLRDFWKIDGQPTLWHEIEALKENPSVSSETWDAIDAVRKVGNIGAHMERDINLIIEVDQGEAAALIELIEILIEDWYVARHKREEHLARVKRIGDAKERARRAATGASPPSGTS